MFQNTQQSYSYAQQRFPYNSKLNDRAKYMRKNPTQAEAYIWENYFSNIPDIRILRQRVIWNFIVDFYISSLKLVIEIDGDIHDTREQYDRERTEFLTWLWLTVVRLKNNQVLHDFENTKPYLNTLFYSQ